MGLEGIKLNSKPYREHRKQLLEHAEVNALYAKEHFDDTVRDMFSGIDAERITPEERQNILNIVSHTAKRVSAGAATSSAAEHYAREKNNIELMLSGDKNVAERFLKRWAPTQTAGHDTVHAIFAYANSHGKSLVPAYEKVEKEGDETNDRASVLEEGYVDLMLNPSDAREIYTSLKDKGVWRSKRMQDLNGFIKMELSPIERIRLAILSKTNPVLWGTLMWEAHAFRNRENQNELRKFAGENRNPELPTIMQHIYEDSQKAAPDKNLMVKEFLRIGAPIAARYRNKAQVQLAEAA